MREPNKSKLWTHPEDAYLQSNHGKLTMLMMAEDLGRTKKAVESRIKVLRGLGRMSTERISTGPKHDSVQMSRFHAADIAALRSEAASYLTYLVNERGYPAGRALLVARKLKAHLAMPVEWVVPRLNKPVAQWVEELAA